MMSFVAGVSLNFRENSITLRKLQIFTSISENFAKSPFQASILHQPVDVMLGAVLRSGHFEDISDA